MVFIIVKDIFDFLLLQEKVGFIFEFNGEVVIKDDGEERFDVIFKNVIVNYNVKDYKWYWDYGFVYGDYYLIEFGNRLLKMGLL